jgi:arsenate reductase
MVSVPTVLFVCEHGAAKSILAAAYFNKLAQEMGLHIRAFARGTNPDPALSQKTVSGLLADGLAPSDSQPVRISPADLEEAHRIVTFCALPSEYHLNTKVHDWQDVPAVSEDYARARDEILARLHHLFAQIKKED